ncbi:hypothetical protein [Lacinutrix sp. 5H-3-7-4]|uniref:hypothetical protein n=1 Tax=Lacinutrix sp. (strain 5H-3-7-4) TaxID=983544 RepID=UPI00020A35C9|nr:hypothetical protein [Lacinutrix sp. 5H-3-7-4]AEH01319.1 hypothetical protein Lacal_1471 [Lacinutrix sp. 5H-3-7-4]
MKNLKLITTVFLTALLTLTSCQDEIDNETGENPNTNTNAANSQTANNLERSSMYDGSFDDFLDGVSCSSILLPVTATVNNTEITIISQADYQQVLNILGEFNTDDDTVVLQFPFTIALSNYTEVVVTNQAEYDAIIDACEEAEATAQNALTCVDINFPITILTYNLNLDQTGSVVIESEEQLFNYINNFGEDELFSVNYPITVTGAGGSSITISSDADLQSSVEDCIDEEDSIEEAEENAENLEEILVDGIFQVETFINSGIDTANDYVEYTIDFANDLSLVAENTVNTTVQDIQGTYQVTSQTQVFLNLNFTSNASFSLLNQNWEVTSFNNTTISLQSTTNAAVTLVLEQI